MNTLTTNQIDELLTQIELSPVVKYAGPALSSESRLYLSNPYLRAAADRADVDMAQLHNTLTEARFPSFSIKPTQALSAWAEDQGLICGFDLNTVGEHYFLEILQSGKLLIKYQQIIGSRELGMVTEDQKDALIERMSQLIAERERPEQNESVRSRPRG